MEWTPTSLQTSTDSDPLGCIKEHFLHLRFVMFGRETAIPYLLYEMCCTVQPAVHGVPNRNSIVSILALPKGAEASLRSCLQSMEFGAASMRSRRRRALVMVTRDSSWRCQIHHPSSLHRLMPHDLSSPQNPSTLISSNALAITSNIPFLPLFIFSPRRKVVSCQDGGINSARGSPGQHPMCSVFPERD